MVSGKAKTEIFPAISRVLPCYERIVRVRDIFAFFEQFDSSRPIRKRAVNLLQNSRRLARNKSLLCEEFYLEEMWLLSGTVKFYSDLQGFGFITPTEGGPEVFISAKALEMSGLRSLDDGQKVHFDLSEDERTQPSVKALKLI